MAAERVDRHIGVQATQVDDALDSGSRGRGRDGVGHRHLHALEVSADAHGMHEVIEHVDALDRTLYVLGSGEVASDHIDVGGPWRIPQFERVTHQHPDLMASLSKPGREAPTNVSGRSRDKDSHELKFRE